MILTLLGCVGLDTIPEKSEGRNLDGDDSAGDDSGGGGDSSDSADDSGDGENGAPTADAGGDQATDVGAGVILDGSGSDDPDGDALTFRWKLVTRPGGSAIAIVDDDEEIAQLVPDVAGAYTVQLVVDDGDLESDPDQATITAAADGGAPTADAGADQTVAVGDMVYLDGTGSTDPDHDALTYAWTLVSKPGGSSAVLTGGTTPTPRFLVDAAGTFVVELTVSDGSATSKADQVRVNATDGGGSSSSGCGCRQASAGDGLVAVLAAALGAALRPRRRRDARRA